DDETAYVHILRRSLDARGRALTVRVRAVVYAGPPPAGVAYAPLPFRPVPIGAQRVVIVGAGPAGLFAALRCIEQGMKPTVLERGKDVRARRRDIATLTKQHLVDGDSNYCFGEGGAGTYSDGKLYTRATKRGDVLRVLRLLVQHGANPDILVEAHPHIGTNKLPPLIAAIRETILTHGGEVHFGQRVTGLTRTATTLQAVQTHTGQEFAADAFILATGHSARDIYELLHREGILLEAKPFALGVRAEHPQALIDAVQYHGRPRGQWLPAAAYALVHQTHQGGRQRGVFSFCMCPGGYIVPAATAPGEVVVNGMSPSRRDSRFANSGIVVGVEPDDLPADFHRAHGPLAGLRWQQQIEQAACAAAGGTQAAPAQLLPDFLRQRVSRSLTDTSYQPGLTSVDLNAVLPTELAARLREGFAAFGQKINGYASEEAQLVGVESRTSAPVRIPRDRETLRHPQLQNLFPCGEGAGFAGGIVSAAMDGERCAEAAAG
ncbi:MAG: NAD(P)/FAD-dependent oxidoreductase, partial [Hymenobacteraceae bacterium]|nr:NAD(P)/FAD-dependent oxidoreductase [Hymenobacteraceae bacterium]